MRIDDLIWRDHSDLSQIEIKFFVVDVELWDVDVELWDVRMNSEKETSFNKYLNLLIVPAKCLVNK